MTKYYSDGSTPTHCRHGVAWAMTCTQCSPPPTTQAALRSATHAGGWPMTNAACAHGVPLAQPCATCAKFAALAEQDAAIQMGAAWSTCRHGITKGFCPNCDGSPPPAVITTGGITWTGTGSPQCHHAKRGTCPLCTDPPHAVTEALVAGQVCKHGIRGERCHLCHPTAYCAECDAPAPLTPSAYQQGAARTLINDAAAPHLTGHETRLVWNAIGLAGEAGEVAEHIKKGVFHQHGLDTAQLSNELGDVLWYVAALCSILGLDMGSVMQQNLDKLATRYPTGYSHADSRARVDVT